MTKGLEGLLIKAKSSAKRAINAVSTLPQNAYNSAKKTAASLTLGAALLSPTYVAQDSNAEVLLTMETRNSIDFPMRIWQPNNQLMTLLVYADNNRETAQIGKLKSDVKSVQTIGITVNEVEIPKGMLSVGQEKPSPYIHNFEEGGEQKDFFYPYTMSPTNKAKLNNTARFVVGEGPAQRKGWVASYLIRVPHTMPLGTYTFKIKNAQAFGPNGQIQTVKTIPLTVKVVPSVGEYLRSQKIEWIMDQNQGDVIIHVPPFDILPSNKRLEMKKSTDLENWTTLFTNEPYNDYIYSPKEYSDYNGYPNNQNGQKAFYQLKIVD